MGWREMGKGVEGDGEGVWREMGEGEVEVMGGGEGTKSSKAACNHPCHYPRTNLEDSVTCIQYTCEQGTTPLDTAHWIWSG